MPSRSLFALALLCAAAAAHAESISVSEGNAGLKFTRDDPSTPLDASGSWQFPRKLEWKIGSHTLLVYPGLPTAWLDIGHLHPGAHVQVNQIHAQGPLFGYGTGEITGTALGGVVYTVHGGSQKCGTSRITEKLDFVNRTGAKLEVPLYGMGYKPDPNTTSHPVVPDLSGWVVTGTTTYYTQGKDAQPSIHDGAAGFGPVLVRKVVSFTGFNPLYKAKITLDPNAMLTMVTELNVKPATPPARGCLPLKTL